ERRGGIWRVGIGREEHVTRAGRHHHDTVVVLRTHLAIAVADALGGDGRIPEAVGRDRALVVRVVAGALRCVPGGEAVLEIVHVVSFWIQRTDLTLQCAARVAGTTDARSIDSQDRDTAISCRARSSPSVGRRDGAIHATEVMAQEDAALEGLLRARQNVLRDRTPRPQEANCRNQQGRASALHVVHDVLLRSYSTASRWRVAPRSRVVKKVSRNTTSPDRAPGARSAVSLRRDREPGLVLWIEVR